MGNSYAITLYDLNEQLSQLGANVESELPSSLLPDLNEKKHMLYSLVPERASHTIKSDGSITAHYGMWGEVKPQVVVSSTVHDYLNKIGPAPGVTLYFNKHQYDKMINMSYALNHENDHL